MAKGERRENHGRAGVMMQTRAEKATKWTGYHGYHEHTNYSQTPNCISAFHSNSVC